MDSAEKNIQVYRIKRLIKLLANARGAGTSMISLIIPHSADSISRVTKMLNDEIGTASNIKSRVNRLSVLSAITSALQKLKLYNKVPKNGLVVYCGTILTDDNKEKKVTIDFEPFKPINTSLYLCDNKFHTEALAELLESDEKFGFIVMDGKGTLFGTVAGNTREVLYNFNVDLPKKHGRGGQSSVRFARLRVEARANYVRKVAEQATHLYITNDMPNVSGLILAGSAEFKTVLSESPWFDQRLQDKIVAVVDIANGGETGFNQAIEQASDTLSNVKFVQEKKLIKAFFDEVSMDSKKYVFGVTDTMAALEMGAITSLLVWENLETNRVVLKDTQSGEESIVYVNPEQEKDRALFQNPQTGLELDLVDSEPLSDWLINNYSKFGLDSLDFITDRSTEGSQFVKGFGAIGGVLRYSIDALGLEYLDENRMEDSDLDDFW
ncbi:hypothetical protein GEMRC1_010836 [Eukaryota sp. GEM-RC1]